MNALCPAGCSAEAFTMNNTIATKMIVMSNELRTRGSMPGAIRSETISRSCAFTDTVSPPTGGFVSANLTPAVAVIQDPQPPCTDKPNPG